MRLLATIFAVAILVVVPIAIGIATEIVSFTPPPHIEVRHSPLSAHARILAVAHATALRAPPIAG